MKAISLSFSSRAQEYARFRPEYPLHIFQDLSARTRKCTLAWDVGTGSGQAAWGLAQFFDRVIATDASAEQISHAKEHPRIEYRRSPAEASGIADSSVDLITAACAVHWFELQKFYDEVRRVIAPAGVIAVWTYFYPVIEGEAGELLRYYFQELLAPLLPVGQNYYVRYYKDLPFPFVEEEPPCTDMHVLWDLQHLLAFMGTYSTRLRYIELHNVDPLSLVQDKLSKLWGSPEVVKEVRLPLGFRVGRLC